MKVQRIDHYPIYCPYCCRLAQAIPKCGTPIDKEMDIKCKTCKRTFKLSELPIDIMGS